MKRLFKVCVWEGVGDWTELQYFDPHSYGCQRCVFLVLQGCSTGGPAAQLSAGWWLSLQHLISNFSGLQTPSGFPRALSAGCGFPYHILSIIPSDLFLQILTQTSVRFWCVTSSAPCHPVLTLTIVTSEWHVHSVHAQALPPASRLHLTNQCAEPKGSQPN